MQIDPENLTSIPQKRSVGSVCSNAICQDGGRTFMFSYSLIVSMIVFIACIQDACMYRWLWNHESNLVLTVIFGLGSSLIIFLEFTGVCIECGYLKPQTRDDFEKYGDFRILEMHTTDVKPHENYFQRAPMLKQPQAHPVPRRRYIEKMVTTAPQTPAPSDRVHIYIRKGYPLPNHTGFILRIAVMILGFMTMLYDALLLLRLYDHRYLNNRRACGEEETMYPLYSHLIFAFLQMCFLMKHAQFPAHISKPFSRFAFGHLFTANLSYWIYIYIRSVYQHYLRETADAAQGYYIQADVFRQNQKAFNATEPKSCIYSDGYYDQDEFALTEQYLYPLVFEYTFLCCLATLSMFKDVDFNLPHPPEDKPVRRKHFVYQLMTKFTKTFPGILFGLMLVAVTTVLVAYLSLSGNNEKSSNMFFVAFFMYIVILNSFIILSVTISWAKLHTLKHERQNEALVDEVFLVLSMLGSVLFHLFAGFPHVQILIKESDWALINSLVVLLHACGVVCNMILTSFALDILKRRHVKAKHIVEHPGRGSMAFATIILFCLWVVKFFLMKAVRLYEDLQRESYSDLGWNIVCFGLLPFSPIFDFQCGTCLAIAWSNLYSEQAQEKPRDLGFFGQLIRYFLPLRNTDLPGDFSVTRM